MVLVVLFLSKHTVGATVNLTGQTFGRHNLDPLWVSQTMAFLERSRNSKDVKEVKFSTTASLLKIMVHIFLNQEKWQFFGDHTLW